MTSGSVQLEHSSDCTVLRLNSADGTNRLTCAMVAALDDAVTALDRQLPLIVTGNARFFSAGADLNEIAALSGSQALAFARLGQHLMAAVASHPVLTLAAVRGYCMGGGLDLALACDRRIVAPNAVFGHRGAALGIITGWGGTQRLPRLIGKAQALQMFLCAETFHARAAIACGLVNGVSDDPVLAAKRECRAALCYPEPFA